MSENNSLHDCSKQLCLYIARLELSDSVKERHNLATRTALVDSECTVTEPVRDLVL
jgi:hypothetical protein